MRSDASSRPSPGALARLVLSTRLVELTDARLLTPHGDGYHLTPLGRDLVEALSPLDTWSRRWARERDTAIPQG
ncbi:winged helix-turn-helix transcriptional regulator [Streptomyces sp. NPDC056948]|uniref:winged helix-turn-helix transcriptional regulator n=1 Tax=Streptomyces sp. NPDC056948 TaxID=3345975 RepID=UPI00364107C6